MMLLVGLIFLSTLPTQAVSSETVYGKGAKAQLREPQPWLQPAWHLPMMAALSPALPIASSEPRSTATVQVAPNSIRRGCGVEPLYMGRPPTHVSR